MDRQRNGRRCAHCDHKFAFEPKETSDAGLTDRLFQRMIEDVSGNGTLFFTERQLWYEFSRRLRRKGWGCFFFFAPVFKSNPGSPTVSLSGFSSLGKRWTDVHGPLEKLLRTPQAGQAPLSGASEPDLTAYSFDRALVTDHAEVAAMLVANHFHFENNCAVLSLDGYPYEMAPTIMEMLRRNPQLQVFALHDASVASCRLPLILREEAWFPDTTIRIIDLGLRPSHAQSMRLFTGHLQQPVTEDLRQMLAPEEVTWLEQGNIAEVQVLRPERLMRAIYQGFARSAEIDAAGDGDTGIIWIYDSGADFYAADSFG